MIKRIGLGAAALLLSTFVVAAVVYASGGAVPLRFSAQPGPDLGTFSIVSGDIQSGGNDFVTTGAGRFKHSAASQMDLDTDGYALFTDAAGTGWTGIRLGGTTSGYPMIVRSSQALLMKLADNSQYATLYAAAIGSVAGGGGTRAIYLQGATGSQRVAVAAPIQYSWTSSATDGEGGTIDLSMARSAAGVWQVNRATAADGATNIGVYEATLTADGTQTLTASGLLPAGSHCFGVSSVITTTFSGGGGDRTGYDIGVTGDLDRYGSITGISAATNSDNTDATADPTGWTGTAAADVFVTFTGGATDFTAGAIQVQAHCSVPIVATQ